MPSTLHAGPTPTGYWASELQRYLARSPALLGALLALIGFILAGGGAYLAALGFCSPVGSTPSRTYGTVTYGTVAKLTL